MDESSPHAKDLPFLAGFSPLKQELWIRTIYAITQRLSLPTNEPVFHYTSADGYEKIIKHGIIWATNAAYLNDEGELRYPAFLAKAILRELIDGTDVREEKLLLYTVAASLEGHYVLRSLYVTSFSSEGNRLSQWRAYCPRGGYSLGFDANRLRHVLLNAQEYRFGPVIYDSEEQCSRLRAIVEETLALRRELRAKYPDVAPAEFEGELANTLTIALSEQLVFFKSKDFGEEAERRFVRVVFGTDGVSFRERAGVLTPYLETDFRESGKLLPLVKVYVSPLGDQEGAVHAARLALQREGYEHADKMVERAAYHLRFP